MPAAAQNATVSAGRLAPDAAWSWSGYFEALALICFLLALLWLLMRFVSKRGGAPGLLLSARGLHVESRLALGPRKWVFLLRCLDRRLLIGVTDHAITMLADLETRDNAPPEQTTSEPSEYSDDGSGKSAAPGVGCFARLLKKAGGMPDA
jgi:flagellar protein FliO/FliZ